jgi:hypothetical protein
MAWVETASSSFSARHHSASAHDAVLLLESLELTRERLGRLFAQLPPRICVVLHESPASLTASNPLLVLRRRTSAPAARRYIAGWAAGEELHVLCPRALRERASRVEGSREMLALSAAALYARRVIELCNPDLPRRTLSPRRVRIELQWAWLLDGGARYFAGQTRHARAAIGRRLREGEAPRFPPALRDAALLGGTVYDLLAREQGEQAAVQLACRLHPQGPRAALAAAFGAGTLARTERAWHAHLSSLAGGR